MITYEKYAASVALVMLFAASLLGPVPTASAAFRQSITDIEAPSAAGPGESFPVSVTVRYDFTGEGEVGIFSRIRDPATGSGVAIASGGYRLVHGVGEVTWDFQIVARNAAGVWRLEAYVFHYVDHQEPEDDTKAFTVAIGEPTASFDFALSLDPSVVTIRQGRYALADLSVGIITGQPPEVTLTYTIPPISGISATLSKAKGIPLFKSTLRIETTNRTPPGTYTINIAGVAGTITRVASLTVKVESAQQPGFDFDIRVEPTAVSLNPGDSASCTIDVSLIGGLAQEVSLKFERLDFGNQLTIPLIIHGSSGTPPFTATLEISTTAEAPPGTYTINIVGVSGALERTATVALTVTERPQPQPISTDWAVGELWMLPSNPRPGDQVTFSAKIFAVSSGKPFPQEVNFRVRVDRMPVGAGTVLALREGVAITATPGTRWRATAGSHTVVFEVDPADGAVYDDPDTRNNSGELSFTISQTTQPSSGFDFSITVRPESQSLTPEGSVVYDVYVDLEGGTSDTVSLTVSGLPEDATFAFDPQTENPHFQSRLTIYIPEFTAAGAPIPAGTYILEVTGEGGGLVRTANTTLVVEAVAVVATQLPQTTMQSTVTSEPTSEAATQVITQAAGGLGGGAIVLLLLMVAVVAGAAYYVGRRRKAKPEPAP